MIPLPIDDLLPRILEAVRSSGRLVVEAAPGAGKTTRVPAALLDAGLADGRSVVVTEPRRLAARLAARRVAEERGQRVGDEVGYAVRFEQAMSARTQLVYMTEGALLRKLVSEPHLADVGVVVLDELHERHLETDLLLALLQRLVRTERPDLKLVVMSATLRGIPLEEYLDAPVVSSEGMLFPVRIEHASDPDDRPLERRVASAVRRVLRDGPGGDVLVFLPGAFEIRRSLEAVRRVAAEDGATALPLHGDLSIEEQVRAIEPAAGRKIILSTNVAESSITVAGVVTVVDTGLERVAGHDPWTGLPTLVTQKVSRASATQRAGRAGRTRPGRVVRLYTKGDYEARPEHDVPEVRRADLTGTLLALAAANVGNPSELAWLAPPPPAAVAAARALLTNLGAIDDRGELTAIGRRCLALPLPPRLARLVIAGENLGIAADAALLAALLGERDIRARERAHFDGSRVVHDIVAAPSDLLALADLFRETEALGFSASTLRAAGLDGRAVRAVDRARRQLERRARNRAAPPRDFEEAESAACRAILTAFPDRVARRRPGKPRQLVLQSGQTAMLSDRSAVQTAPFLVAVDADQRSGRAPVVRLASRIEPDWLLELFPDAVQTTETLTFNTETERVDRISRLTYGSVVLDEERGAADPSDEASSLLAQAVQRRLQLDRDARFARLKHRLALAARELPELELPSIGETELGDAVREACRGCTRLDEVDWSTVTRALLSRLSGEQRAALERELPEQVPLPGRRRVQVHYEPDRAPWIASRLQDFFGMEEGPRICRGRVPLVMHLLAPNQRAVQVTHDLAGFWTRHYPSLRRELGRRYPRHAWPEDGRTATPPARTSRRRG